MSRPIIIDTDPGNDDAVLLAVAAAATDLNIVGVSTVAGNTTLKHATRNARSILDWFGQAEVPVAAGARSPLIRDPEVADIHGKKGLHTVPPAPSTDPLDVAGANALIKWAKSQSQKPTLLAVGPLTNVALALAIEPDFSDMLADVYVMGGAATVGGNVTPTAEYNFYADPEAAKRVIRDLQPTLVGLDVTNRAIVSSEMIRKWAHRSEPFATIASWLVYAPHQQIEESLDAGARPASHDAVVVVSLLADILEFEAFPSKVITSSECRGTLVCDQRSGRDDTDSYSMVDVATAIDADTFESTLVETVEGIESVMKEQ